MTTAYESFAESVTEEENLQFRLIEAVPADDVVEFRFYAASDRALNAANLAQAEQLRIANLIAVAQAGNPSAGDVRANLDVRKRAMQMALDALGLTS